MAAKKPTLLERIEKPRADCAVYGCGALTVTREKTPTGWANFCEYHYVEYHHQQSARRVKEKLGLETVEEMKAYCRNVLMNPGSVFKRRKSPTEYWRKVLEEAPQGSIAERSAREFLDKRGGTVAREPGEDDEELAA